MSLATWTVTLAAAGLLIHALREKKESANVAATEAPFGVSTDAFSTTDPVSGRVKPMPAMPSDDEEIEPRPGDFARGA